LNAEIVLAPEKLFGVDGAEYPAIQIKQKLGDQTLGCL
jgi:hypothetical protein